MIAVVARLNVQAGKEQEFEQIAAELGAQVHDKEPGCALYVLCKGKEAGAYVMLERYADQAAFGAHGQSQHFRDAFPKLGACLSGAPQIEILTELD